MVSTNEVHIFRKLKGNSFTDKEMRAYSGRFTRNQLGPESELEIWIQIPNSVLSPQYHSASKLCIKYLLIILGQTKIIHYCMFK